MLRMAARAAAGSAESTSSATAAWMVAVVSVCPIESCNSWAIRLRSASSSSRAAASASRSAADGPSSRGADHRRAFVTSTQTATASRMHTAATTQLHPPDTRTDVPNRLARASPPSQFPGRERPMMNSTPLASAPVHPTATCSTSQSGVRQRSRPSEPEVRRPATGSGSGTRSSRRADTTSARRTGRASPTTPTSTAQNSRTRTNCTLLGADRHDSAGNRAKGSSGRLASAPQ